MPRQRIASGFTLIELLVTLFVVALVAGIAVVRLGGSDRSEILDREARRFVHVLEMAREEAMLDGEEWGMTLSAERYAFVRLDLDTDRWTEIPDRPFAARELPEGLSLRLTVADRGRIGGVETTAITRDRGGPRPALLMLSSGEMTPFSLLVSSRDVDEGLRLGSDGFARVAIERGTPRT